MSEPPLISSLQNSRVKTIVKLRNRHHRDKLGKLLIEGYRPLLRALENGYPIEEIYFCRELFLGENEDNLISDLARQGAEVFEVSKPVFQKMAYRDRPEGLLGIGPQRRRHLSDLEFKPNGLYLIAEAIEKPGNLGTILRSSDAAGVDALILCDACTDFFNPNVVCASIGTLFTVPIAEASTDEAIAWCREHQIQTMAATPHTDLAFTDADMTGPTAIVVGTEQYGLSDRWMREANCQVVIPMYGLADSLNVATSTTLLIYEAVRQRRVAGMM